MHGHMPPFTPFGNVPHNIRNKRVNNGPWVIGNDQDNVTFRGDIVKGDNLFQLYYNLFYCRNISHKGSRGSGFKGS